MPENIDFETEIQYLFQIQEIQHFSKWVREEQLAPGLEMYESHPEQSSKIMGDSLKILISPFTMEQIRMNYSMTTFLNNFTDPPLTVIQLISNGNCGENPRWDMEYNGEYMGLRLCIYLYWNNYKLTCTHAKKGRKGGIAFCYFQELKWKYPIK